jgi:hypothetical protein
MEKPMDTHKKDLTNTELKIPRRISLTRIQGFKNENNGVVVGWEHDCPQKGESYTIYLDGGKVLKTSAVVSMSENPGVLELETVNSIYHVEYLI